MFRRVRKLSAIVCTVALLAATALPAAGEPPEAMAGKDTAPAMVDAMLLRPLGLVALGIGTVLFVVPVAPITLLTRPSEIGKPFKALVLGPAKYVYADPLGSH